MSQYNTTPDFNAVIKDIRTRLRALANTQATPVYTVATLPTAATVTGGTIIYVSDATAGQRFQGWDSTAAAWVPLG